MKKKHRVLTWVTVLALAMVLIAGGIFATNPDVSVDKTASLNTDGKTYNVTLSVTGSEVTSQQTADVILAIDLSNSMTDDDSQNLAITKDAAIDFIETTLNTNADGNVRVSIVGYGTHAYAYNFTTGKWNKIGSIQGDTDTYFTKNQSTAKNVINSDNFKPQGINGDSGGTNTEGGFLACAEVMATSSSENKITVFMTDGVPTFYYDGNNYRDVKGNGYEVSDNTFNQAVDAGLALKEAGSTIYTIGLLTDYSADSAEMECANYLLSKDDSYTRKTERRETTYTARTDADAYAADYVPVTNPTTAATEIAKVYQDLAVKVNDLANGSVTDIIPATFALSEGEQAKLEAAGATVTKNQDGTTTIIWPVALNKETKKLSYNLVPADGQYGTAFTNKSATLSYAVDGTDKTETFPQPSVLVNTVTGNAEKEITVYDTLTMDPITDLEKTYLHDNGESELTAYDPQVTDGVDGALTTCTINDDGKLVFSANRVGTYTVTYNLKAVTDTTTNASPVTTATVVITVNPIAITVTADSDSKIYSGSALTKATATATGLKNGDTLNTVTVTGSQTDVGTAKNIPSGAKIINGTVDVTENYEISYVEGTLEVTPKAVTMTSADDEKIYDGTALTNNTVTADGFIEGEGATYDVTGIITNVGTAENKFTYALNQNTKADNYTITIKTGTLEVTAKALTVTAGSDSRVYNGAPLTKNSATPEGLAEGDKMDSVTVTGSQTDAGTSNNIADNAVILRGETDVTKNYEISYADGTLEVTPKAVTMTSANDEKVYDGEPLTNNTVTADGFIEGQGATYTVTGTQTNVGSSKNTFDYTLNEGTLADNYTITKTEGTLRVKQGELTLNTEDHMRYMQGYPEGDFRPNRQMTRAEVAVMFCRLLNNAMEINSDTNSPFSDIAKGQWYYNEVCFMAEHGILKGYEDGTFRPDKAITRAEFAIICTRFDVARNSEVKPIATSFPDVIKGVWYYDGVMQAAANGWVGGSDDGNFYPENNITRAEVVTVVNRVLERTPDKAYIDNAVATKALEFKTYSDIKGHWAYHDIYEASTSHDYEKNDSGIETKWLRHWLELYTVAFHVTYSDDDPAAVIVAKGTTVTLPKAADINGINSADFAGWSLTKDGAKLLGDTYVVNTADSYVSESGIDHNIIHIYGILK